MRHEDADLQESGVYSKIFLPVRLVCTSGSLQGSECANWGEILNIGRGTSNHIVLNEDAASKVHARIVLVDGEYFIEDLNSSNGTFLQGRQIERERLQNGHIIRIGMTGFRFETIMHEGAVQSRGWLIGAIIAAGLLAVSAVTAIFVKLL